TERRKAFIDLADRGRFMGVTGQLMPMLMHPDRLADTALIGTVKTMARNVGKPAFVRQQRAIMGRVDSRPLLGSIACPTLVLCGREDKLTPLARSEEIAAAIPNARLAIVERSGHLSTLEQPDAVTAALREWLAR
ncbi:MAG: alpha/beta hydrolase, partial [Burkholderiales bacterium]